MSRTNLLTNIHFSSINQKISLDSSVLFLGSCFSENISNRLDMRKVSVLSNPHGILFDTLSMEKAIDDIALRRLYGFEDLLYENEVYLSLNHHSDFSDYTADGSLQKINTSIEWAYRFVQSASHIVLTLGSAFSYYHLSSNAFVANCHKIPQKEFEKKLVEIERIESALNHIYQQLITINPSIQIILTISPVRHLRDGVIENNRSKARLIEAANRFISLHPQVYYFPSYEIVIDVLRDYRYYDIDYAHPNILATDIVFEYFVDACVDSYSATMLEKFYHLTIAKNHRPRFPNTSAHKAFLERQLALCLDYQSKFQYLDFSSEIQHFQDALDAFSSSKN